MLNLFESLTRLITERWQAEKPEGRRHSYRCQCGRPVFFRNSLCLGCDQPLGYEPISGELMSVQPGPLPDTWRPHGAHEESALWKRCENFSSPAGCNWLVPVKDEEPLCRACRLNRTIPDLEDAENCRWWRLIEIAKRRLVSQLLGLKLPVRSKVSEDEERGVMFDLVRSSGDGPCVMTGHADGLVTLNIEEADDAVRERIRNELREPYRTLLGHFRHEIGHYYWDRLVADSQWHEPFRALFGDERQDYSLALKAYYDQGPPADWADRYISTYSAAHPWEDWAETWAHYLHVVDSLETSLGFGLRGDDVELEIEPFLPQDLYDDDAADAHRFLLLINSWVRLTTALNEVARSMGQHDFYPFVMSRPVLKKLHFIHMVINQFAGQEPTDRS